MCLFSSGRKCLLWGLLPALFFGGGQEKAAAAESPRTLSPFIQSIFPRGGRQGTEVEISIQGKYLGGACEIRFSGTGVKGKVVAGGPGTGKARGWHRLSGIGEAELVPQARLSGPMPWVIAIMVALTVIAAADRC